MMSSATASPKSPPPTGYRGRFAPSPTGDLHMGSLIAAVASYLEARIRGGSWLMRIEDLDPPREVSGSADRILAALEAFGFAWDGPVVRQSSRTEAYTEALRLLFDKGVAYPCACSRGEIAAAARHEGPEGPVYPGTCRAGLPAGRGGRAIRVRTSGEALCFTDLLQGEICQEIARDIGDFVIRRADGHFAYQLAVVVDDAWQGITDIVRGADLLLSTPRQIWLQRQLGLPTPRYQHVPLLLDTAGRKLSKQARSAPVDPGHPARTLCHALALLRQEPPAELARAAPADVWSWATAHWRPDRLHGTARMTLAPTCIDSPA